MTWQYDDPELYEKEKAEVEAHFPGLRFGRVLRGQGQRWWVL